MESMSESVETLIHRYVAAASGFVEMLLAITHGQHPIHSWKSGALPQLGTLPDGTVFRFHGIGCRFTRDDVELDVDFGVDPYVIGFDAWRLYFFQKNDEQSLPLEFFRESLSTLFGENRLEKLDDAPPHLFFLPVKARH